VPTVMIFTGLACGMLLTAVGLVLWDGRQQIPGLARAVQAIGWLAGAMLFTGALLAWQGDRGLSAPALRLTLMAALAASAGIHRRCHSPWGDVMLILPALILAVASLFWTSGPTGAGASILPVVLARLAVAVCGGLGAHAMGEALSEIVAPVHHAGQTRAIAYTLLTLLVGGTSLTNLCQRGTVWGGTASAGGLAGAWLVWSATWLGPRQRSRPQAVLTVVAALLLILACFSHISN
jgi:hypothetical protein